VTCGVTWWRRYRTIKRVANPNLRMTAATEVYGRCMSRTNIDIDELACQAVMERFHLSSKRDAVNLALRRLAEEPLDVHDARRLRGSGWDGDVDEMRAGRIG
jgi:Arc/MetJ family transcription regulator